MSEPSQRAPLGYWPELAAFMLTVGAVWIDGWSARDLIWGLWISSLCVGYSYIVLQCIRSVLVKPVPLLHLLPKLSGALFSLAFFTVHFGMFHFVHSAFLNLFFPLYLGSDENLLIPWVLISKTLGAYWLMVLANFIAHYEDFRPGDAALMDFQKPYANVIRMHGLIFVFAGLAAFHLDHLAIYPVLMVYFFPWRIISKPKRPLTQ